MSTRESAKCAMWVTLHLGLHGLEFWGMEKKKCFVSLGRCHCGTRGDDRPVHEE